MIILQFCSPETHEMLDASLIPTILLPRPDFHLGQTAPSVPSCYMLIVANTNYFLYIIC